MICPQTALGRLEDLKKKELARAADCMAINKRSILVRQLQARNVAETSAANEAVGNLVENEEYAMAVWLYRRARVTVLNMEASCSPLNICLIALRVIIQLQGKKASGEDEDDDGDDNNDDQMEFFQAFAAIGEKRDQGFIFQLADRAGDMAKDDNFTEEILRKVADGHIN